MQRCGCRFMVLPLLNTDPVSMNARVSSFMPATEESPRLGKGDAEAINAHIEQAYRQISFHAFKADRDAVLESQLRRGKITVREFVRSLLLSNKFRNDFYRCNSNYRVVEQLVGPKTVAGDCHPRCPGGRPAAPDHSRC